jgi:hypothetical protein
MTTDMSNSLNDRKPVKVSRFDEDEEYEETEGLNQRDETYMGTSKNNYASARNYKRS